MEQTRKKRKPAGRGERHSAAWGKRFGVLVLVLVAELAFAVARAATCEIGKARRRDCAVHE